MSTPTLRDRDIRISLHGELQRAHQRYASETLFIHELGLCQGNARIDLAVVNGSLSGYEIKSERDTLQRLPHQVDIYSKALDYVTIVSSESHIHKAIDLIPEWWGVITTVSEQSDILFRLVRQPQINPYIDPYAVAQLLWRPEVITILGEIGVTKGLMGKSRPVLWKTLAEALPVDELRGRVRQVLKVREHWRSELPPTLHDGSSQFSAKLSHSPSRSMEGRNRLLRCRPS